MNTKYRLLSKALKEMANVSVSISAYESLPSKPKKKKKKKSIELLKTEFPK